MAISKAQQIFNDLLDKYGRDIANAFLKAVHDLTGSADIQRVAAAINAGNIEGAIDAMHLDPAAYGPLLDAIQQTYGAGGQAAVDALPALKTPDDTALVVRFDGRNLRAESYLRDHSSTLVTRVLDDQRTAIRSALTAGMERGENPKTTALDVVGRINRVTGQREGGIIGLTAPQEQYVANARAELASEDPAILRKFMDRARRSKTWDRSIAKAIREGRGLTPEMQARALAAYKARLLALRGETIGRTEALTALHASAYEAAQQAVDKGVAQNAIRRVWKSSGDGRVRHTHQVMNGESVGLAEAFRSPSGALLRYPGDASLGAPGAETINCRCWMATRVDWLANLS